MRDEYMLVEDCYVYKHLSPVDTGMNATITEFDVFNTDLAQSIINEA